MTKEDVAKWAQDNPDVVHGFILRVVVRFLSKYYVNQNLGIPINTEPLADTCISAIGSEEKDLVQSLLCGIVSNTLTQWGFKVLDSKEGHVWFEGVKRDYPSWWN